MLSETKIIFYNIPSRFRGYWAVEGGGSEEMDQRQCFHIISFNPIKNSE